MDKRLTEAELVSMSTDPFKGIVAMDRLIAEVRRLRRIIATFDARWSNVQIAAEVRAIVREREEESR